MNVLLTTGDCNGIGIEVMLKALESIQHRERFNDITFRIVTNARTLKSYVRQIHPNAAVQAKYLHIGNRRHKIIDCPTEAAIEFGKQTRDAGKLAAESLETAVQMLVHSQADAMVTMPVSKKSLYDAGWSYPGQTEMLAAYYPDATPQMILCTPTVRVALATIHIPLRNVAKELSTQGIERSVLSLHETLRRDFAITKPTIAVLGLNPHAGEQGKIGKEETKIIIPAIHAAIANGVNVAGPFPADGFFAHAAYKHYHGILAMYHDQGLIPLKLLARGGGVNVTAGLPLVRTSPDHGTAFDVAGKGKADCQSTIRAIEMAVAIVHNRSKKKSVTQKE